MTITMDDRQIRTLEQIEQVLEGSQGITFTRLRRGQLYRWIESVLKRFKYFELKRKEKGLVRAYLQRLSGLSRAQMTRLALKYLLDGAIRPSRGPRNRFPAKYTSADKKLLALTDNAHGRLSGPATKHILGRQHRVYYDKRFARLQGISIAQIHRFRKSQCLPTGLPSLHRTTRHVRPSQFTILFNL